jgi:hypothetical protein
MRECEHEVEVIPSKLIIIRYHKRVLISKYILTSNRSELSSNCKERLKNTTKDKKMYKIT